MTTLAEFPTPCLVLDRTKMERNLARMRDRAAALGRMRSALGEIVIEVRNRFN